MANKNGSNNPAMIAGKAFMPKVANATFFYNGMVAFEAKANTASNVNIQTTQNQIRAGQQNAVIGVLTSERTIDVSFSTPEWKAEFLAANIGEKIKMGNWAFEVLDLNIASANGVITLPDIPSDNVIHININDTWIKIPTESTTVDLTPYGVSGDECISVIGMFNAFGKRINLSADSEPLIGKLILSAPIFVGTQGTRGEGQYIFPAFALSGNWNHQMNSDSSYEISGQPIATTSEICGEGQTYGYYQEKRIDEKNDIFASIVAVPSVIELSTEETETIKAYGIRGELYEKTELSGATFATEDTAVFTVDASTGVIAPVAKGTGAVTVTYNGLLANVEVEVL